MKAVILAAGEGSRMRPLTDVRPKVMLPVANKPIIEHLFNILVDAGVKEIVVVTGYQASQVEQYFGNGNKWGAVVEYCRQDEPRGTADAILKIEPLVGETFLVVNGDTLYKPQDIAMLAGLPSSAMGIIQVSDARGMGVVSLEGEKISRIVEKPTLHQQILPTPGFTSSTGRFFRLLQGWAFHSGGNMNFLVPYRH